MSTQRAFLTATTCLLILAVLFGFGGKHTSQASFISNASETSSIELPYKGRLLDKSGSPVDDGTYDFNFSIYADPTAGQLLWSESRLQQPVNNGNIHVSLGENYPISIDLIEAGELWLEVWVRAADETVYTQLSPRQLLEAPSQTSISSLTNGSTCPHDHYGDYWSGSGTYGLKLSNDTGLALDAISEASYGVRGTSGIDVGVIGISQTGSGVHGESTHGASVSGKSTHGLGVKGESTNNYGVHGVSTNNYGVYGESENKFGVYGVGDFNWTPKPENPVGVLGQSGAANGIGVYGTGAKYGVFAKSGFLTGLKAEGANGGYGVHTSHSGDPMFSGNALYAAEYGYGEAAFIGINNTNNTSDVLHLNTNGGGHGLYVESAGKDGVYVEYATDDGIQVQGAGDYAGVFQGDIYVTGSILKPSLAIFGVNESGKKLQPGTVVSVLEVISSGMQMPPILLNVLPAGSGTPVIGVVQGRAELEVIETGRTSAENQRLVPRQGPAAPGEYLTILIYGIVQLDASLSAGPIQAGQKLVVGDQGTLQAQRSLVIDGLRLEESLPSLGTALQELHQNGPLWVLVNPN